MSGHSHSQVNGHEFAVMVQGFFRRRYRAYCPPCRAMGPVRRKLNEAISDTIGHVRLHCRVSIPAMRGR